MGNLSNKREMPPQKFAAVIIGMHAAGKATIHYVLTALNPEVVKNCSLSVWDVGDSRIKSLSQLDFKNANAIIWVQDCRFDQDPIFITQAKEELFKFLEEYGEQCHPLLVYANKQDLPNAYNIEQITQLLDLRSLDGKRHWQVFGTCANQKKGLVEGFQWLEKTVEDPPCFNNTKSANKV